MRPAPQPRKESHELTYDELVELCTTIGGLPPPETDTAEDWDQWLVGSWMIAHCKEAKSPEDVQAGASEAARFLLEHFPNRSGLIRQLERMLGRPLAPDELGKKARRSAARGY
jgi:hypothetical protein